MFLSINSLCHVWIYLYWLGFLLPYYRVYFPTSLHAWDFLLNAKHWQLYPVGWLYILYSYKYSWHAFKLLGNNLIILGMLLNYPHFLNQGTNVQIGTITCPTSLNYKSYSQDLNPDQYDSKVKCLYIMECWSNSSQPPESLEKILKDQEIRNF